MKKFMILFLAGVIGAALIGCGSGDQGTTAGDTAGGGSENIMPNSKPKAKTPPMDKTPATATAGTGAPATAGATAGSTPPAAAPGGKPAAATAGAGAPATAGAPAPATAGAGAPKTGG